MSETFGDMPATGIFQRRQRKYTADGGFTDLFVIKTSDLATFLAANAVGSTSGTFRLAEITEESTKGVSRMSLQYVTPSAYTLRYGGTGIVNQEGDSNAQEVPIWLHPDCSNPEDAGTGNPPIIGGNAKPGVESYIKPAPTYTRSEVVSSFAFTEANLIDNVGKRQAPTGVTSPTANAWLKMSKTPVPEGENFRIVETWQHSPTLWDEDIYEAAT
jgi:hypothetical protein